MFKSLCDRCMSTTESKFGVAMLLALFAGAAMASTGTVASTDPFYVLYTIVMTWSQGGMAVGLSVAALIIGAFVGIAKSTAMPALVGLAIAAVFAWGPSVIEDIIIGAVL